MYTRLALLVVVLVLLSDVTKAQEKLRERQARAIAAATSPQRLARLQKAVQKALDANDVSVTPALPLTGTERIPFALPGSFTALR